MTYRQVKDLLKGLAIDVPVEVADLAVEPGSEGFEQLRCLHVVCVCVCVCARALVPARVREPMNLSRPSPGP